MSWLAALPLAIWLYLLVGHGRFWRADLRLPPAPDEPPARWPAVAIVVPARDEAAVLPASLPSLLAQEYPGPARVVLVDDGSSDGTGAIARRLAGAAASGLPLEVVAGQPRPAGWAGKVWALEQGVRAAGAGTPEWILLTDADIAHGPGSLRALVAAAMGGGADSVSLMARLRVATGWERLIVPAFVYFFAQLYPFRWVNRPAARTAAAAGGCVLVRVDALARAGGPAAIAGAVIDDVALARALKRSGARIWLGLAPPAGPAGVTSVRPYPRLGDLWDMVARSAFTQLRYSVTLLALTVAGLALVFAGPPAATIAGAAAGDPLAAGLGGAAWVVMTATYVPILRYYGLGPARALTLPAVAALYGAMTVSSAARHRRGGVSWKGRRYTDAPEPA